MFVTSLSSYFPLLKLFFRLNSCFFHSPLFFCWLPLARLEEPRPQALLWVPAWHLTFICALSEMNFSLCGLDYTASSVSSYQCFVWCSVPPGLLEVTLPVQLWEPGLPNVYTFGFLGKVWSSAWLLSFPWAEHFGLSYSLTLGYLWLLWQVPGGPQLIAESTSKCTAFCLIRYTCTLLKRV